MEKSRTLQSDVGDSPGKYYAATAGVYIPSTTYTYLENNYKMEYVKARNLASSIAVPPQGLGTETIQSTSRARPIFNTCYHEKILGFNYPYFVCTLVPGAYYGAWQPYMRMATTGNFGNIGPQLVATWADVDGCQRRAWWTMQPRFESEFSFLNFIYEMKDFKSLVKASSNWTLTTKKLKTAFKKFYQHIGGDKNFTPKFGKTLSESSNVTAQAWLSYQFAIKPLISDVKNCISIWEKTVASAQEEFSKRGLDRQIAHYSEVLGINYQGSWGTGNTAWIYTGARQLALFTATMEYTYSYIMRIGMDAVKKYIGMNVTAEVVWNAVPFTFLFDYFLKVGDAIHSMALDPNVKTTLLQYCESILLTSHYGKAANPNASCVKIFYAPSVNGGKGVPDASGYVPIMGYQSTIYHRRVGQPNKGAALPRFSLPGKTQQWNMVALVRSMMK